MLGIESLIAVISLVLTAFGPGYSIGYNSVKNKPPSPQSQRFILTIYF